MSQIRIKKGYKYVVQERVEITIPFRASSWIRVQGPDGRDITKLSPDGILTIEPGYAWDGASGPAIDTRNFLGASLIHDVLYQMIRLHLKEFVPHDWAFPVADFAYVLRKEADRILWALCLGAGMSRIRAWWVYYGVREGAWWAARPEAEPKAITAPLVLAEVL